MPGLIGVDYYRDFNPGIYVIEISVDNLYFDAMVVMIRIMRPPKSYYYPLELSFRSHISELLYRDIFSNCSLIYTIYHYYE